VSAKKWRVADGSGVPRWILLVASGGKAATARIASLRFAIDTGIHAGLSIAP
jgi:hypothetical protein